MLRQALGVDESALNYSHAERLVSNETPESQILDFKEEVPKNLEFAKDIAAMANGGGGVIILGLKDKNNLPFAITPVNLVNEVSRLEQVINSNIHPFPLVRMHERTVNDGDSVGIIFVDVLPSEGVPHAVDEGGGRLGFYIRTGQHRTPLNEAQVSLMYRERFRRRTAVEDRLSQLADHAHTGASMTEPRIFVAAVPTIASNRLFHPNLSTIKGVRATHSNWSPIINDSVGEVVPRQIRTNFRRLEFTGVEFTIDHLSRGGWVEFYDDGAYLGVVAGSESTTPDGGKGIVFIDSVLVINVVGRLLGYWYLADHFRYSGEVALRCGVVGQGNPWILPTKERQTGPRSSDENYMTATGIFHQRDRVFSDRTIDVSDLAPDALLLTTAKDLLDDLFTAFRRPEASQLTRDGKFRRSSVGESLVPTLEKWMKRHGIEFAPE